MFSDAKVIATRGFRTLLITMLLASLAFASSSTRPVQAASYTLVVNDNTDPLSLPTGTPCLTGGDCTLREAVREANTKIAPGNTITIQLQASTTYTLTTDVVLVLHSPDPVTIVGGGSGSTVVDGNNATEVFDIQSGAVVMMNALRIQRGRADGSSSPLISGGGIANAGTLTLTGVDVRGNYAISNGGGIYNASGSLDLSNTTVDAGNYALNDGGGIYTSGGVVTITGGVIGESSAGNSAGQNGGGIYIADNTVTLSNTQVVDNVAKYGGGIYGAGGSITLISATVSGNQASSRGGGMYSAGTLVVGGGAAGNSAITGNTSAGPAGGIYIASGTATLAQVTVTSNTATGLYSSGGGIASQSFNQLSLTDATISSNTATGGGGAILVTGPLTLSHSTLSNNSAGWFGGAIFSGGTITIDSSAITGNKATGGGGGIENENTLTVTNDSISGNSATGSGGGIENDGSSTQLVVASTNLSSNSARLYGGGIFSSGSATVNASAIVSNTSSDGGAVYVGGGSVEITNSTIYGNVTNLKGGSGNGGGIDDEGTLLLLTNATISGNTTAGSGGAIYTSSSGATTHLENSIVASSTGDMNCVGPVMDLGYNLDDGTSCGFNLPTDLHGVNPKLGAPALNDGGTTDTLALQSGSPAIDAGGSSVNNCPSTDQNGVARPQGAACDIGAYEYIPPAPTISSLKPTSGPVGGGTSVTIAGTGFIPGATVAFGGASATDVVVIPDGTIITATTPAHAPGTVDVVVTNPGHAPGDQKATASAAFTYRAYLYIPIIFKDSQ